MSSVSAIPYNLMKKSTTAKASSLFHSYNAISLIKMGRVRNNSNCLFLSARMLATDPSDPLRKTPPVLPSGPPGYEPSVPPELTQSPNVPEFDPIAPEKIADPPPLSPGPNPGPDFPGPPIPSPPGPNIPRPPMPSPPAPDIPPWSPDIYPPSPDVEPPKPPRPLTPSDIPPPIII